MDQQMQYGALEAILFVAGEAVPLEEIARALDVTIMELDALIERWQADMRAHKRGIELVRMEDKVQLRTNALYSAQVQQALKPLGERTLSRSVLETLSIVAYKQPITRGEIEGIKGVSADYSVRTLLERGLIAAVGRKDTLGKPILYGTTDEFMRHFGLQTLSDLPPLPEQPPEEEIGI